MHHKNPNAAHSLTSSLIWVNHQRTLKNSSSQDGFFKGIFSSVSTDCVTYEAEVLGLLAAVEKLYSSKGPVPVKHVAIFEFTILSVWVNPTGRI